jgi:hypothetical protein
MQMLRHNNLRRALADRYGQNSVLALWHAARAFPQRLLEALRYYLLADVDFDMRDANRCRKNLNGF